MPGNAPKGYAPAELTVTVTGSGGMVTVAACGELDLTTRPTLQMTLRGVIERAEAGDVLCLTLDISGVVFCDSAGLEMTAWAFNRLREAGLCETGDTAPGFRMVVRDRSQPARVLRLGKFDTLFTIETA